ncbi:SDR family oxidoreductase [Novosphingobium resinovorum]|uniref:SDR family oxidoreductase n=1 Tax=Novosphingobium resinovorum TaxID=158500 RepID=UPI003B8A9424
MFKQDVLAGKAILVTGGGSGLGREIARSLSARGAVVHICGRRQALLDETAAQISAATGGAVHAHACDIRDADAVDAMIEAIWQTGPLSGLFNNAAANFIAPTKDLSARGFRAVTSTVIDGTFYTTLSCGKRWIRDGIAGAVVSNLTTWVWTGSAFVVPSAMGKTAIDAMTKSLAVEWGPYGIRLNAVAPGPFPTEGAWEKLNPIPDTQSSATNCETVPLRRFGDMPELCNLITFLLSDGCNYLTGQTIAIDGAQHLAGPGTFADLTNLTGEQWDAARAAIAGSVAKEKAQRGSN